MTAATSTPKAPTPPRSSAAGGLEKLVEPERGGVPPGGEPRPDAEPDAGDVPDDDFDAAEDEPVEAPEAGPVGPDEALEAEEEGVEEGRVELNEEDVPPGFEPVEPAPDGVDDPAAEVLPAELVVVELPVVELPGVELPGAELPPLEPPVVEPLVGEGRDELVEPVEAAEPVDVAPGFAALFSAVRSMVTGRLDVPEDEDGLSGLPEVSLPPEEDVPSEDFLSVAICTPPGPCRSQGFHYTHLFAERHHRSSDSSALQ